MPSPVGHSLMGYLIYRSVAHPIGLKKWQLMGLSILAANAADLDFIPGFVVGEPNRYHHGISHSLGIAVLWGAICSFWLASTKRAAVRGAFVLFFSLYASHLVLDCFSVDTSPPYGVPLLWPLSNTYLIAPFEFWLDIQRVDSGAAFLPSLVSLHNLWAVIVECLALFPALMLIRILKMPPLAHVKKPRREGES